jgi:large subunit ribosomal protein L13
MIKRETKNIDVEGKVLGRVATEIAVALRGKDRPDFAPNKDLGDVVVIKNIEKIKVTGQKADKKIYYRHTGYLGGLKEETYKKLFERDPSEVLRRAVYGMLPKNRLRDKQIKRLKFE